MLGVVIGYQVWHDNSSNAEKKPDKVYLCVREDKYKNWVGDVGIKETSHKDYGLYYFSSLAMGESIAAQIEGSLFYREGEKKKAMKVFGISEEEIKDGRILMEKYKNTVNEMAYVGIEGTPFDGVYCFKRRAIRDREAKKFENCYLSMDKAEMLEKYNISESEIRDGGYLMSGEVKDYLENMKTQKAKEAKKAEKAAKMASATEVQENGNSVVVKETKVSVDANLLRNMIDVVSQKNDVVEIQMSTGDKYRLAIRRFFYAEPGCSFANCAYTDGSGNVQVKEKAVDSLLEAGEITMVEPSKVKYSNGFAILRNCDDAYSPDIKHDKMGKTYISHCLDEVVINVGQVVSVMGFTHYTEINMTKITPDNHRLIHTYLMEKSKESK